MKCSQEKCTNDAVFRYVWLKSEVACPKCMQIALALADMMGFTTPRLTLEVLPDGAIGVCRSEDGE